jgi:hypothetical protein
MAKQRRPELLKKIKEIAVSKFLSEHNIHEDEAALEVTNFEKTMQLKSVLLKAQDP